MKFPNGFECLRVKQLSIAVLAAGHQHRVVISERNRHNFTLVNLDFVDYLIAQNVVIDDLAAVGRDDD